MKVKIAVVDRRIDRFCELGLIRHGFRVIKLPSHKNLGEGVASHTDMLILRLGDEYISTAEYCEENTELFSMLSSVVRGGRFSFTSDKLGEVYPNDCVLNALVMKDVMFARLSSLSPYVKERADALGIKTVNTNQGYPACTVLKLSDTAAITADCGMAKVLSENGIDVTKIQAGHISLPPHEYGFIGGCAGVYDGCVYFLGNPEGHPSWDLIRGAIRRAGLEMVALSDLELRDLGGILFAEGDI